MKLKAFLCILLAILTCIPSLSVSALTSIDTEGGITPRSPHAVYVSDGGTGDGSSAASPLSSFANAFKALKDTGGYIVICGQVTVSTSKLKTAACASPVTITSCYGGVDYRASGAKLTVKIESLYHSSAIKYLQRHPTSSCATTIFT